MTDLAVLAQGGNGEVIAKEDRISGCSPDRPMQLSLKRLVLKTLKAPHTCSEAGGMRKSGGLSVYQFIFALASNQLWMKQEAWLTRVYPGTRAAV